MDKKEFNKRKTFGLKYNVWDKKLKDISYTECTKLIQHFLYYNLEEKYVDFVNEFHNIENMNIKHTIPPKLNFKKLKSGNDDILSISEIRKFKIDEFLKNEKNEI